MNPSMLLVALVLGAASRPQVPRELSVTFPDVRNPNYYNIMSCTGAVRQRTRLRIGRDGRPLTKSGQVVFRCSGPIETRIERIEFEPGYFHDTDWAWRFETVDGREVMSGYGAKVMSPARQDLRFYVREGYLDP